MGSGSHLYINHIARLIIRAQVDNRLDTCIWFNRYNNSSFFLFLFNYRQCYNQNQNSHSHHTDQGNYCGSADDCCRLCYHPCSCQNKNWKPLLMYSCKKILLVVGPSETTWDGCSDVNVCVTDVSAVGGDGSGGEGDDGAGSLDGNNTPVDVTIIVVIVVVVTIIVVVMQFAKVGWIRGSEERTV